MKNGLVSKRMSDFLADLVGEDSLILSKAEIGDWLTEKVYGPIADNMLKAAERREEAKRREERPRPC
jgi:hypothetical protein